MYIFVQSYILFLNYQIKTVKNCMDNTEKVYRKKCIICADSN